MAEFTHSRAVVSAIIEKEINGEVHIYVQTRWKPDADPTNTGTLEIPAGGIDLNENVYAAICREVKEESGLEITDFIDDYSSSAQVSTPGNSSIVFRPFICQQSTETTGGQAWVGYVFRCHAKGTEKVNLQEAKDPRWISIEELKQILKFSPEKVFSLQLATLRYYTQTLHSKIIKI